MTETPGPDDRAGWELIWKSGDIPPRYRSLAAPNATVAEWAALIPTGGFVLDVGCGVGRHLLYLGERGFRLARVDISPTAIRLTQEACVERQMSFEGHVSDMTALPWPDETFDAVLSTSTIHHHLRADILRTLQEIKRVLKPGGICLVDFPSTDRLDYQRLRDQVAAGEITEVEPNTFVDERPQFEDSDGFLPHHYCDELDARDLLADFDVLRLWVDGRVSPQGRPSQWVGWVRRPLAED